MMKTKASIGQISLTLLAWVIAEPSAKLSGVNCLLLVANRSDTK